MEIKSAHLKSILKEMDGHKNIVKVEGVSTSLLNDNCKVLPIYNLKEISNDIMNEVVTKFIEDNNDKIIEMYKQSIIDKLNLISTSLNKEIKENNEFLKKYTKEKS